jgi:hypothetical protein
MKDLQQLYQEYWKLLNTHDFTASILDDSVLEKHIQFLKLLSSVGNKPGHSICRKNRTDSMIAVAGINILFV